MIRLSRLRLGKDPFRVLGLDRTASKADVKKKFREMAMEHHPDKSDGDATKMEEINRAYNLLIKEGAYERLHLKRSGAGGGAGMGSKAQPFGSGAASAAPGAEDRPSGTWSAEEYAKVAALDPETERVTPEGKFMYQNRDTGEWVTVSQQIVKAKQPRYQGFADRASEELKEQLRNMNSQKSKASSTKEAYMKTKEAELLHVVVFRGWWGMMFTAMFTAVSLYIVWCRSTQYLDFKVEKRKHYEKYQEVKVRNAVEYRDARAQYAESTAAAALVLLAAASKKQKEDPIQPVEPYDTAFTARPKHFNTLVS